MTHPSDCRSQRPDTATPAAGSRRPRPLLLALALAVCVSGCSRSTAPQPEALAAEPGIVTVVIEIGGQQIRREVEQVQPGTTIADVMSRIEEPAIKIIGSGSTAFVDSIGELGTTAGLGWTFRVNGEWADRGVGDYALEPPAEVRWSHGTFTVP